MKLSVHCKEQARAKAVAEWAILEVLANPQTDYPSTRGGANGREPFVCRRCGTAQRKAVGGGLCVPYCPSCKEAVTVFVDQQETALRPDQKAKGVQSYNGRDGRIRR